MTIHTNRERSVARRIEHLARAGYATKGLLYATLGLLAVQAALGSGSPEGSDGAIRTLGHQPFGVGLLWLTAAGMGCYALWRAVQAVLDPERNGRDMKAIAKRIGYGVSSVSHVALGVLALQLATRGSGAGSAESAQTYAARLMSNEIGHLFVAAVGLIVIGVGLYQFYRARQTEVGREWKTGEMSREERRLALLSGRLGLAARGVVFTVMGVAAVRAGVETDPSEVQGVGGALREIASSTFGTTLLLVVAAGLLCYGGYQFVQARYRRIPA